jgi:hypothetical protein
MNDSASRTDAGQWAEPEPDIGYCPYCEERDKVLCTACGKCLSCCQCSE